MEDYITNEETVKILKEHRITFQSDFGWNTSVLKALDKAIEIMSNDTANKEN